MSAPLLALLLAMTPPSTTGTPSSTEAALAPTCRAAVLDLQPGDGVTVERARALTEVVTAEVGATMDCAVLSRSEIEALMNFEVKRQMGGCDTDSCIAELGEALGVSRLISGTVQKVDDDTLVSLRLVDMERAHVLARVTDATRREDALLPFVGWLARRLIVGDDAAGERPVDDTRVVERRMSLWRGLAWTGVVGSGVVLVLAGASGAGSLVANEALTGLKTARDVDRARIEGLEGAGPWLAGGANLGLYLGAGLAVVGGALFFLPAEDLVPAPGQERR